MANDLSELLASLNSLQNQSLSIIRLSEPISAPQPSNRNSDISASTVENPTPESLEADLTHYKVNHLFQVLRS